MVALLDYADAESSSLKLLPTKTVSDAITGGAHAAIMLSRAVSVPKNLAGAKRPS